MTAAALWRALADPMKYGHDVGGGDGNGNKRQVVTEASALDHDAALTFGLDNSGLVATTGAAGDKNDLTSVNEDDLNILLGTLQQRLAPFQATAERDRHFASAGVGSGGHDPRVAFIAMYRDGQRRVLEEVVTSLEGEKARRRMKRRRRRRV